MYEVKTTSGEQGLFATQDIEAGALILFERPLLSLEVSEESNEPSEDGKKALVDEALALSEKSFRRLKKHCIRAYGPVKASELTKDRLKAKVDVKQLLVDTVLKDGSRIKMEYQPYSRTTYNLFDDISVLRRSCNPNVHVSMIEKENRQRMQVRAMRILKAGEEMMFSQSNPFKAKKRRNEAPGVMNCRCAVCSGAKAKGKPNENVYCDLERKFDVVYDFRKHFFALGQVIDLSDAHQDQELYDKVKAINAVPRKRLEEVKAACVWINRCKKQYGLMHSCFADFYEVLHLINFAYVVEHGNGWMWRNDMADVDLSGNYSDQDVAEQRDEDQAELEDWEMAKSSSVSAEPQYEGERGSTEAATLLQSTPATGDNGSEDDRGHTEDDGQDTSDDSSDSPETKSLLQAHANAFTTKKKQMIITVICWGFEHHMAQESLKHVWNLARRHDPWKKMLNQECSELGFFLQGKEDGGFETVSLEKVTEKLDGLEM